MDALLDYSFRQYNNSKVMNDIGVVQINLDGSGVLKALTRLISFLLCPSKLAFNSRSVDVLRNDFEDAVKLHSNIFVFVF